jgi:anti-sigma factor RsiW
VNRRKAERWLSRYLDGELDSRRTAILETWLARDPTLRAQAEAWKAKGQQLRAWASQAPAAAEGWADVREALARDRLLRPDHADPPVFNSRWSWAAATLVMVLTAAGIGIWQHRPAIKAAGVKPAVSAEVEWAETEIPGASTMVFQDEETGLTVIWLVEGNEAENGHAGS